MINSINDQAKVRRMESGAGTGAGAGVGLFHAIRRGRDRRERAQGSPRFAAAHHPAVLAVSEIGRRLLDLLAIAVCVTCSTFLLTVLLFVLI